ncbi:MAG: hypothetical protein ACI3VN_04695 [Candidatus Onthomonas sp.]
MKKLSALLLSLLLLFSLSAPAAALDTAGQTVSTQTIDLEDGWTVTETLTVNDNARTASRAATKEQTYSYQGNTIAIIAVTGVFRYDGSTVSVSSKVVSQKDTYNGWSYSQSSFTSSGGTITLTGKLTKLLQPSVPVNLVLSCDVNGNIT